jgi:hypothetical protein
VLALTMGGASPTYRVEGHRLWVLKADPNGALIRAGLQSTPDGSVLQNWMRACRGRTPRCEQGALALKPYSVGVATTDASGKVRTPPLPPGRYWVLGDAKVDNQHLMWSQPVDVTASGGSLTLDKRNAQPVD